MAEWTQEKINKLKSIWGSSVSAAEMVSIFGGIFTRNAIIGKAHRIGLAQKKPGRIAGSKREPTVRVQVYEQPTLPIINPSLYVSFLDIKHGQCRAIVGNDSKSRGLALFCGAPIKESSHFSFCPYHHSIYTYPARSR